MDNNPLESHDPPMFLRLVDDHKSPNTTSGMSERLDRQRDHVQREPGWGPMYIPPLPDVRAYTEFRRLCDDLRANVSELMQCVAGDELTDEAAGPIVEIEHLLERMYDCPWGEPEALKKVVVAIQSQVLNVDWTLDHARFVQNAVSFLRAQYAINSRTVDEIYGAIRQFGFDVFRGTVSQL